MAETKQVTRDGPQAQRASLTIRPAESRDVPVMAELFVQLWEVELPMLLVAGKEKSARFLERQLLSEDGRRLRNNFVAEHDGEVVAMYRVSTTDEPWPPFARPGVIRDLAECLGAGSIPKLLWPIVQNIITQVGEEWPGTLYMSNLVIKPRHRGDRLGAAIFRHFYDEARRRGCDRIAGQVMDAGAVEFYKAMEKVLPLTAQFSGPLPRGRLARRFAAVESVMIWSAVPQK